MARSVRAVRGLWPDHNPLRRGVDRIEAVILGALTVAFLIAAPLSAMAAAHAAFGIGSATARAQQASWHQVPAILLEAAAPGSLYTGNQSWAQARWTAPNGTARTGAVLAPPGTQAGGTIMVWVDRSGKVTTAPLEPSQVRNQALLIAALAPVAVAVVLLCIGLVGHRVFESRRAAAWETDWGATEPQWTHRH